MNVRPLWKKINEQNSRYLGYMDVVPNQKEIYDFNENNSLIKNNKKLKLLMEK
jgi:hypothetical protein